MTDLSDKLSAYLDNELSAQEAADVEAWLERDSDAQAQLEALMQADTLAREVFRAQLDEPAPISAARAIRTAPTPAPRPARRPVWGAIAAGLALFIIGGAGGYALHALRGQPPAGGWIQDVADYHAVYAGQSRHLVEVGADQSAHIETWLGKTIGAPFSIPDLSAHDLTFEGGRLLVADGAPVAQLMYSAADGRVVALCLQGSDAGPADFRRNTLNGFDVISWRGEDASYVVIGQQGQPDLPAIARSAARSI